MRITITIDYADELFERLRYRKRSLPEDVLFEKLGAAMADLTASGDYPMKSTAKAEIVSVVLEKHPNADSLSVVKVFDYTCVCRTEDWAGIESAVYIPPDNTVPVSRPEFAFLSGDAKADGRARIKAKKLRGVVSFGLLIPAPEGFEIGDDVAEFLDVQHYEPPTEQEKNGILGGDVESPPNVHAPKYDLDAFRRYASKAFTAGEPVYVTEKIDGANARYTFHDGKMYCGSRNLWKREFTDYSHITKEALLATGCDETKADDILNSLSKKGNQTNVWWRCLRANPGIENYCRANPGAVVYGEVFGHVQKLLYGHKDGQVSFVCFDILNNGVWLTPQELLQTCTDFQIPMVPIFNEIRDGQLVPIDYDFDRLCDLAEGPSSYADVNHMKEGIVVSPMSNREDDYFGRVKFKVVAGAYLEKYR